MSGFLLDTHVLVWLAEPLRISKNLREHLEDSKRLCISAASAYELSQKVRLDKLPEVAGILARWDELVGALMAEELPLGSRDLIRAGSLAWGHRDPFDRMIVAQAQAHGLQVLTRDRAIRSFAGVECVEWA